MTIDAEVHFWKYKKGTGAALIRNNKTLQEDQLPSQVALNLKRNGVDNCIAIAAEPVEVETRFLAELALTHPVIAGVIGWIDLTEAKAAEKIRELSSYTAIKGFKTTFPGDFSTRQQVMETLAQHRYSLDLQIDAGTDAAACSHWFQSFPEQNFILENAGNPNTGQPPASSWIGQIKKMAENPNLFCKVAGFFTLGQWKSWKPADFYPFLDVLFESFGPNRLLYASDWPFILLSGSYVQWKSLLEKYSERLNEEEKEGFFGGNAARIYLL